MCPALFVTNQIRCFTCIEVNFLRRFDAWMQVEGSLLLQKFSNFMRQEEQKVLRREANIKKMTRNDSGGKMVVVVVVVLVLVVMVALVSPSGCIDTANL